MVNDTLGGSWFACGCSSNVVPQSLGMSTIQSFRSASSKLAERISISHSPALVLSRIDIAFNCSMLVLGSSTLQGIVLCPSSLHAACLWFPPIATNCLLKGKTITSRKDSISGLSFIDCMSFLNLPFFIERGFGGKPSICPSLATTCSLGMNSVSSSIISYVLLHP